MALRRSYTAACSASGPVTAAYRRKIQSGNLRLDEEQLALASRLDALHSSLVSSDSRILPDEHLKTAAEYYEAASSSSSVAFWRERFRSSSSIPSELTNVAVLAARALRHRTTLGSLTSKEGFDGACPKGLYVHGSVGVGKSLLMDLFYSVCDGTQSSGKSGDYYPIQRRRKRCHFHEFMLDVHTRIHVYKTKHPRADPIPHVAASLAQEARLLCFDEMQITDIADAMIVKRLFTLLFDLGVVVVTTSNRPPEALYEGGLNRSLFVPFIDTLKESMIVVSMRSNHDYRKDISSLGSVGCDNSPNSSGKPSYVWPSDQDSARKILKDWFARGWEGQQTTTREEVLQVAMGRTIKAARANDKCAWFKFSELCHQPLGAADYLAIAERFPIVIVDHVPQLGANSYNEARRFVTLVDALYEARTKLILAASVPRERLFVGFEAMIESHDGDEEIALEKSMVDGSASSDVGERAHINTIQDREGDGESVVIGEGGSSSSSSTTIIRTRDGNMEWSATGRVGVSLAQLSAVQEVSFSFQRAESRIAEMSGSHWSTCSGEES